LAFSHYSNRGYYRINSRFDEPEIILRWGYRLLYLEMFLFLLVSMFYWDYPQTLPFAGAILAFFYVAQIWKNAQLEDEGEIPETIDSTDREYFTTVE